MKIKRERQVRLDELVKWITNQKFEKGQQIQFTVKNDKPNDSMILFYERDGEIFGNFFTNSYNLNDLFTITEEVEITEDTQLNLVDIYKDYGLPLEVAFCKNTSVKEILKLDKESKIDTKFIHIQNPDGSIGELIWSKERGLVD